MKETFLTAEIACDRASKHWYQGSGEDFLLNSILVLRLNLGLHYDDIGKISLKYLSETSEDITFRKDLEVKIHTCKRWYKIEDWAGHCALSGSTFIDPQISLLT